MPTLLHDLSILFVRDLDTLKREVELYPDDESLWVERTGLPNTGGALVQHLIGNLRHFIGATLGQTGYVRQRDLEFSSRGASRATLLDGIAAARQDVETTLERLPLSELDLPFPLQIGGHDVRLGLWLMHLSTHLAFHLGQIDYHRRAVTGDRQSADAVGVAPLITPSPTMH